MEKQKISFLAGLMNDYKKGSNADKLGIISDIFGIVVAVITFLASNLAVSKLFKLKPEALPFLITLTAFFIALELFFIGMLVQGSKFAKQNIQSLYFLVILLIVIWGSGFFLLSMAFELYLELIKTLFVDYG